MKSESLRHPKSSSTKKSLRPAKTAIADVMTPQPYTIGIDQTLTTAHVMMREHRIRHLPVLERGRIVGVLTQRDLYFLETIASVDADKDRVGDAMSPDAYVVAPDAPLEDVARAMAKRKLGCAVIVERGRVAGIFTANDALQILGGARG